MRDGSWVGLELIEPLDSEMFQLLRGVADAIPRADVIFTVAGTDEATVVDDAELLRQLGFSASRERLLSSTESYSVIVYPTGQQRHAELLARYVVPTPAIVENPVAAEMTLVLGSDHREVSFFFPVGEAETLGAIAAFGDVAIPALDNVTSAPASTTSSPPSPTTSLAPGSTTVPPTAAVMPGLAPEGESCS